MSLDLPALRSAVEARGAVVRVLVVSTAGSIPREAGASMLVWAEGTADTIGGGALENMAIREARAMLGGSQPVVRTVPLGPGLRQCCGGSVTLAWERFETGNVPDTLPFARAMGAARGAPPRPAPGAAPVLRDGWLAEAGPAAPRPVWVWGAGHVGRAVVAVLAPFPGLAITWIDVEPGSFPPAIPAGVEAVPAADPPALVPYAPPDAEHLVLTRSHEVDLTLCHALLRHGFASLGLIGSATKRARFRSRLAALGHPVAQISRIACPIGDPSLGKHPQAIAVGVAAALIRAGGARSEEDRTG